MADQDENSGGRQPSGHHQALQFIVGVIALAKAIDGFFGILGKLCGDTRAPAGTKVKAWTFCFFGLMACFLIYYFLVYWSLSLADLESIWSGLTVPNIIGLGCAVVILFVLTLAVSDPKESSCRNFLGLGSKAGAYCAVGVYVLREVTF